MLPGHPLELTRTVFKELFIFLLEGRITFLPKGESTFAVSSRPIIQVLPHPHHVMLKKRYGVTRFSDLYKCRLLSCANESAAVTLIFDLVIHNAIFSQANKFLGRVCNQDFKTV